MVYKWSVIIEKKVAGNIDILANEEHRRDSDIPEGLLLAGDGPFDEIVKDS